MSITILYSISVLGLLRQRRRYRIPRRGGAARLGGRHGGATIAAEIVVQEHFSDFELGATNTAMTTTVSVAFAWQSSSWIDRRNIRMSIWLSFSRSPGVSGKGDWSAVRQKRKSPHRCNPSPVQVIKALSELPPCAAAPLVGLNLDAEKEQAWQFVCFGSFSGCHAIAELLLLIRPYEVSIRESVLVRRQSRGNNLLIYKSCGW